MVDVKPKVLFTDGEGPLVFKDLARDISQRLISEANNGYVLFDALSMWVAHNTESGQRHFEPGDTLAVLVPHLLAHGIRDEDLNEESRDVRLANGVTGYIRDLYERGWQVRVISTAYEHLWNYAGPRLQIPTENIVSTPLCLDCLRTTVWSEKLSEEVSKYEAEILNRRENILEAQQQFKEGHSLSEVFTQGGMSNLSAVFDELYFSTLPQYGFEPLSQTEVVGGNRKINAVRNLIDQLSIEPKDIIYVGDSITDDRAHKFVKENGGLAIAVNGDEFAIRNANIAVATEDMRFLRPLLEAFTTSGIEGAKSFVENQRSMSIGKERFFSQENGICRYDLVEGQLEGLIGIHHEYRQRMRGSSIPLL